MSFPAGASPSSEAARSRAWGRTNLERVCNRLEPWEHGVIALADRYPDWFVFNHVRVTSPPALEVEALIALADTALAGRDHRMIRFEFAEHGLPFRRALNDRGWRTELGVRMRFSGPRPGPADGIREVPYAAADELRAAWHTEELPTVPLGDHLRHAREVELARGARVFGALRPDGRLDGYAQVEATEDAAEVTDVYVRREARGRGLGTALTAAAIRHAPAVDDLWISADAEDRPQRLYARLGFRPVAWDIQYVRLPAA